MGEDSYCFSGTTMDDRYGPIDDSNPYFRLRCLIVKDCNQTEKSYTVVQGNNSEYKCKEGESVKVSNGFRGEIQCQEYDTVCNHRNREHLYCIDGCNRNGYCLRGYCHCMEGYTGPTCAIKQ